MKARRVPVLTSSILLFAASVALATPEQARAVQAGFVIYGIIIAALALILTVFAEWFYIVISRGARPIVFFVLLFACFVFALGAFISMSIDKGANFVLVASYVAKVLIEIPAIRKACAPSEKNLLKAVIIINVIGVIGAAVFMFGCILSYASGSL